MLVTAAAIPQTGWKVLCSSAEREREREREITEINFAVTIFTVVRRSRAAQSLNDNLELVMSSR